MNERPKEGKRDNDPFTTGLKMWSATKPGRRVHVFTPFRLGSSLKKREGRGREMPGRDRREGRIFAMYTSRRRPPQQVCLKGVLLLLFPSCSPQEGMDVERGNQRERRR